MKIKTLFFILLTTLFTLSSVHAEKMKVIVDTDCNWDDMMAILYLLKKKDVEVLAITTTGTGMAEWKDSAPSILKLLELAHKPNIPVSYGAKAPLSPYATLPKEWRQGVTNTFNIPLPDNPNPPVKLPSWKLMTNLILNSKEKVTILALAPLTNVALALEENPSLAQNIQQIVISGGAVNHEGNIVGKPHGFVNKCAEYNIFLDAKAAEVVIASGIPITLVPLNATGDAPMTDRLYNKYKDKEKNPSAQFVMDVIRPYVKSNTTNTVNFWDPATTAVMTNPSIGNYKVMNLIVNLKTGPNFACMTTSENGCPVRVCTSIKTSAFNSLFFKTIFKRNKP